jgi:hypothetical protein
MHPLGWLPVFVGLNLEALAGKTRANLSIGEEGTVVSLGGLIKPDRVVLHICCERLLLNPLLHITGCLPYLYLTEMSVIFDCVDVDT